MGETHAPVVQLDDPGLRGGLECLQVESPMAASTSSTVGRDRAAAISVASRASGGRRARRSRTRSCRFAGIGMSRPCRSEHLLRAWTVRSRARRRGCRPSAHEGARATARTAARPGEWRAGGRALEVPVARSGSARSGRWALPARDREGRRRRSLRPPCHEHADPLVSKAAGDEGEHALGLGIEPLDIVDPYEQRSFTGESGEDTQGGDRDRPLGGLLLLGLPQQQGHLEGTPLRPGKLGHRVSRVVSQQIAERRVGHLRLRLDRTAGQRRDSCVPTPRRALRSTARSSRSLPHRRGAGRSGRPRSRPGSRPGSQLLVPADDRLRFLEHLWGLLGRRDYIMEEADRARPTRRPEVILVRS